MPISNILPVRLEGYLHFFKVIFFEGPPSNTVGSSITPTSIIYNVIYKFYLVAKATQAFTAICKSMQSSTNQKENIQRAAYLLKPFALFFSIICKPSLPASKRAPPEDDSEVQYCPPVFTPSSFRVHLKVLLSPCRHSQSATSPLHYLHQPF